MEHIFENNYANLSTGSLSAMSYTRSKVALTISSCFSLMQTHIISIISGEKVLSSTAKSLKISFDLLINST
jgi:hypothetical protein